MMRHSETRLSLYKSEQLMQLIRDVGSYPEFLPWCINSRVLKKYNDNEFDAELTIGYKHLRQRYTSHVKVDPKAKTINVYAISGPFSNLRNFWQFESLKKGCNITFTLEFEFKSMILSRLLHTFFCKAVHAMVDSFEKRANFLYGSKKESK